MKQYAADKIRNIALAGHSDSGKTSLAEALLYKAGATDRLGKTADGNTVCDFDAEEIKRRVSVSTAIAPFEWKDSKVNLLDTPGLFDFATGLYEGIRPAESVLITVSARGGLTVGAEKAYKQAKIQGKSKIIFVTKTDTEHADFYKLLEEMRATFGSSVCPLVIPAMNGDAVEGYVDLVTNKAYKYDDKGNASEYPVPQIAMMDDLMAELNEAVAETSEEFLEKFLMEEPFTPEEIAEGILEGVRSGSMTPVLCGSATTLAGVDLLMKAIVTYLPTAAEKGAEEAVEGDDTVTVECTEDAPLAGYVFKTIADPFIGKLSYFKVVSGKLDGSVTPTNVRTGQPERLGKLIFVRGKKQEDAAAVVAGDICAITKLSETVTGDTLCDPKRIVAFKGIDFPNATLSMAVEAKKKGDEGKIAQGIARLIEEDPVIRFEQNAETRQQIISGLGEQHLDVIVSKLKSKFGVEVSLVKPRVAYRETIRKKAKVQGRHKKQSGGHGQFGDVWIEFEPCDSEELVFEEKVFGGSVPKNFFPAVEKGLQDSVKKGVIAGYPMVGVKATLLDGSYHPVDSSEMAFKTAASLAYKAGIPQASPTLLEPIGTVKVVVPDTNTGDIMGDLNKRRGRVLGMNPTEDGMQEIVGEVPMSEMHDFTTILRSITAGRGSFTLEFERYEQLPQMLEAAVIEEAKALNEAE